MKICMQLRFRDYFINQADEKPQALIITAFYNQTCKWIFAIRRKLKPKKKGYTTRITL